VPLVALTVAVVVAMVRDRVQCTTVPNLLWRVLASVATWAMESAWWSAAPVFWSKECGHLLIFRRSQPICTLVTCTQVPSAHLFACAF